jgi:hypothetical protein
MALVRESDHRHSQLVSLSIKKLVKTKNKQVFYNFSFLKLIFLFSDSDLDKFYNLYTIIHNTKKWFDLRQSAHFV